MLRRFPIEFFILIVVPFFIFTTFFIFSPAAFSSFSLVTLRSVAFLLFFGDLAFVLAFSLAYFYCFGKLFHHCTQKFRGQPSTFFPFLKSLLCIVLLVGAHTALTGTIIDAVGTQSPARVLAANAALERFDVAMFDEQPLIIMQWFARVPFFDTLLVATYTNLGIILALLTLVLLFNKLLFRRFILSFALTTLLGLPFWYFYPAISPDELYRKNVVGVTDLLPLHEQLARTPLTANLLSFLQSLDGHWSSPHIGQFAVTSFPSMHVAWGVLIAYFATALWWPLGIVAIPYALANAASTVYTLQHYAVDSIAGIIVTLLALLVAHYCFVLERRYYTGTHWQFAALDVIKKDAQSIFAIVRNALLFRLPK